MKLFQLCCILTKDNRQTATIIHRHPNAMRKFTLTGILTRWREQNLARKTKAASAKLANKLTGQDARQAAIEYLKEQRSTDAISGLLKRFNYTIDKSITDQEEKEAIVSHIVSQGEQAIAPVKEFLVQANSVGWGIRILKQLIPEEALVEFLLSILPTGDTTFNESEIEKRFDLLTNLMEYQDPRIKHYILELLHDHDDRIRLLAIELTAKLNAEEARTSLLDMYINQEETNRIRNKILSSFAVLDWTVKGYKKSVEDLLPDGFFINKDNQIRQRPGS